MNTLAWIGTGACDPNKDLEQAIITLVVVTGWIGIAYLLKNVYKTKQSKAAKIALTVPTIVLAVAATLAIYAITSIAYACSG